SYIVPAPLPATDFNTAAPLPVRSVKMIPPLAQVGRDRTTPAALAVRTFRPLPSGRAVAMLPSPLTKTIRLPSAEKTASVTVVGKVTFWSPTRTTVVPSEMRARPTLYPGACPMDPVPLGLFVPGCCPQAASRAADAATTAP